VWVSNYNTTLTGNYLWDINENNNLNVLVGSEFNKSGVRKTDYTFTRTNDLDRFNGTENAQFTTVTPSFPDKYAFLSYFARFNYSFKDKYLLQATLRTDGSSKFGPENRFGFFPSGSIGWIVSKESWFNVKPISYMKLRSSYGVTGNSNLENNAWRAIVAKNPNPYGGDDFNYPINIENPDLKWENSYVFDAGLELGFLDDRITTEISVYRKLSKDVILRLAPPPSYGFTYLYDNLGEIENKGIEFSIKSVNIDKKFRWVTNLNIAHNKNKVNDIGGYSADAIEGGTNDTRVVVGQPLGANFLVRFSHVDPASGKPVYLDINGKETFTWDPKDRVVVGDIYPDVVGGINNTFSYNNWELSLQANFSIGAKIYDSSSKEQLGVMLDWNMRTEIFDRWQKPGDIAEYPRLTLNTETYGSTTRYINTDHWLKDADYLRFKLISVGYNLSSDFCKRVKIGSAKIIASATNFATITNFKGLDPEIARDFDDETDRNMSPNITYLTPSQQKTYNLTLSISF
jgi:TonB-dependent starch-binding outer membrane protein SusC